MRNFLRARPFEELQKVGKNGPVVILNCSDSRCDAIIFASWIAGCHVLPLERASRADAEKMTAELRRAIAQDGRAVRAERHLRPPPAKTYIEPEDMLNGILAKLWGTVVEPVVSFLLSSANGNRSKRIWWCPTGPYTSLPIHAAGLYAPEASKSTYLSQHFQSSYIPTLETLLRTNPSPQKPKLLGISMPTTPGHSPLPGTQAELAAVQAALTASQLERWTKLEGEEVTLSRVLDELKEANWLHLACHGVQNVSEPLSSALLLHDGALQLREIMQAKTGTDPGLVFLSACQTATGDRSMQDEAMHLAGGFLFAGFAGAVATMWSIEDQDGRMVAEHVYKNLMREGRDPDVTEVCAALHQAVEALRQEGVSPLRWVPFIHLGA